MLVQKFNGGDCSIIIDGVNVLLDSSWNDDVDRYLEWMRDEEVNFYLVKGGKDYSREQLNEFLHAMLNDQTCIFFRVVEKSSNKHVGNFLIRDCNFENKTCGIGLLIGERFCRGKRYGREAAKIAFNFIFSFLRLDEISFDVPVENIPAVNMYKALNCSLTGSVREIPSHRSEKLKVERYRLSSKSFFRSKAQ